MSSSLMSTSRYTGGIRRPSSSCYVIRHNLLSSSSSRGGGGRDSSHVCGVFARFKKAIGAGEGDGNADGSVKSVYGDLSRDEYEYDDVEQYYNYMGLNAIGIEYSVFQEPINAGMHPADCILMLAAMEADMPKIEEMLTAGANPDATNHEGKTVKELAKNDEVRDELSK